MSDINESGYSRRIFSMLAKSSAGGFSLFEGGRTVYSSPGQLRLLGYPEDLDSKFTLEQNIEHIHPEDRDRVRQCVLDAFTQKLPTVTYTCRVKRKDGSYIWIEDILDNEFDDAGRHVRSIIRSRDVSARVNNEAALIEREAHYNNLLAHIAAGVVIHTANTTIISANDRAAELLGLAGNTLTGRTAEDEVWAFLREDGSPMPQAEYPVVRILESGEALSEFVIGITTQNAVTWCLVNGFPEHNPDGSIKQVVITFINISPQKAVESQLRRNNETKDRFFRIIAHDLRNSVMTLGTGMRMLSGDSNPSEQQTIIKELQINTEELAKLLENLLEWSRLQQGSLRFSPTEIQLASLIHDQLQLFSPALSQKELVLTTRFDDVPGFSGDAKMIQTILRNLLSNAIKFSPIGAVIDVVISREGDMLVLRIKDSGLGMSPQTLDSLFLLDSQNNREGTAGEPGSGLGLILCKEFVEMHGGELVVESAEGVGSVFSVLFPLKSQSAVEKT